MGSFLHGNRWNSRGKRVIYTAETYAGALLEVLVHCNLGYVPRTHAWIEISLPSQLGIEEVTAEAVPDWDGPSSASTRAFGDRWHDERRTPLLLVPSVVTKGVERNVLLNQDHPEFSAFEASELREVAWDQRLFKYGVR